MMLVGVLEACLQSGKGETGETGATTGSTGGSGEQVSTGGVFTLTSITEGEASSAATMGMTGMTTAGMETSTETTSTGTSSTTDEDTSSTGVMDVCPGIVTELSAALLADARCELLLRFDAEGTVLDWHSACGPVPAMEVFSSKTALEATSTCLDSGKLIGPGTSPFLYHQLPLPPALGGVGIVSNHIGALVYDATIGVDEDGSVVAPLAWQGAPLLGVGAGCAGEFTLDATSYNLLLDGPDDPPALSPMVMTMLSASIAATALPAALGQVVVERALAVGYQGQFKTGGSSYVVLLELSHK